MGEAKGKKEKKKNKGRSFSNLSNNNGNVDEEQDENVAFLRRHLGIDSSSCDESVMSFTVAVPGNNDNDNNNNDRIISTGVERRCSHDAKVNRKVHNKKLTRIFTQQLAETKLPFFHSHAPPLLHLCLYERASLSLIQHVYHLHPEALNGAALFGWLTPLHAAAMRTSESQESILRFLLPLYSGSLVLKVPILPFLLRRVDCLSIVQYCCETIYTKTTPHSLDHAGNSILHLACHLEEEYRNVFSSRASYGGCRSLVVEYLIRTYPALVHHRNKLFESPLESLLKSRKSSTGLAMMLMDATSSHNITRSLCLACRYGASRAVVERLYHQVEPRKTHHMLPLMFGSSELNAMGHEPSDAALAFLLQQTDIFSFCDTPHLNLRNMRAICQYIVAAAEQHVEWKFSDVPMSATGMRLLVQTLFQQETITKISLMNNMDPIHEMKQAMLRAATQANREEEDDEDDTDTLLETLTQCLSNNTHVTHMNLSHNMWPTPEKWLQGLASSPAPKVSLVSLNLSESCLSPECGKVLANIIRTHHSLEKLYLDYTDMGESAILQVLDAVPENPSLHHVKLDPESKTVLERAICVVEQHLHVHRIDFPYFWFHGAACEDDSCLHQQLLPYWRQLQQVAARNDIIRLYRDDFSKQHWVWNVIMPSVSSADTSLLYTVLRLEPQKWSQ